MIQKSFVMMKPDAVQRRLMGKILSRFEEKGLQIVAVKLMQIDEDLAKTHYGATNPLEADLGTIRGDFAMDTGRNIIHASDSPDSAEREINLFFNEDEICDYEIVDNKLIYE